jgi:hypothetical protein
MIRFTAAPTQRRRMSLREFTDFVIPAKVGTQNTPDNWVTTLSLRDEPEIKPELQLRGTRRALGISRAGVSRAGVSVGQHGRESVVV